MKSFARSDDCMYILYSALVVMIILICFNVSNINDKYFVNDLIKYPKFMGIILFTCCPIGVFLNVEEDMKEPEGFVKIFGVLNVFMLATFILAAILGLTGYWFYGEETAANIILNIPVSQSILFLLSHALLRARRYYLEYILYSQMSSTSVAALLRYLDIIAALTGCLPLNFLVLILPAIMDLCVFYESGYGRYKLSLIRDICLISFGVLLSLPRCRRAKVCQLHSFRTKPQLVGYISMKHQLSATLPPHQHTSLPSPESLPSSDQQAKCSINQNRQKSRGGTFCSMWYK
uniref:Amino acid transporter transmembrane domain-containing protein n=1 Tax=Glossina pallidipes TaxID=7398 RepID=A0A1A9ZWM6_GLOPL